MPPREVHKETILRVNYFGLKAFLDGILEKLESEAAIVNTALHAVAIWRDNLDKVKALMALNPDDLTGLIKQRSIDSTRAYNLSKEAVIVITVASTEALIARSLRMNSVTPAAVSTGILQDFAVEFGDKMTKKVACAGRPGLPGEVANAIVFLTSRESGWIKGQDIVIDGGMSAMALSDMLGLVQFGDT